MFQQAALRKKGSALLSGDVIPAKRSTKPIMVVAPYRPENDGFVPESPPLPPPWPRINRYGSDISSDSDGDSDVQYVGGLGQ